MPRPGFQDFYSFAKKLCGQNSYDVGRKYQSDDKALH